MYFCVCDPDVHAFASVQIVTVLFCMRTTGENLLIGHLFFVFLFIVFYLGKVLGGGIQTVLKKCLLLFKCIVPLMQDNYSIA